MVNRTKIICTLGPTAGTPKQIEALALAGMNIARINLSHGTWDQHLQTIRMVKALNKKLAARGKLPSGVGILLDTKGAEVRTGIVEKPIVIEKGELVIFSHRPLRGEKKQVITVNHPGFAHDAREAEQILIDNGKISFTLVSVRDKNSIVARANQEGTIGSRRHVNLPGANLNMPSITNEDWEQLGNACKEGVDFLALSFIRTADEVEEVRTWLAKRKCSMFLIAKIETRQGLENLEEIIRASDGLMVARGDLGAEIPFEQVPVAQDIMVAHSRAAGKPVIVATHMLESMIENPMPTRAEVTDIAHAAMTCTDSTMLSGETASGANPLLALDAMVRVLRETEKHVSSASPMLPVEIRSERDAQAESAVTLALSAKAAAIVVMTKSGTTARDVSRFRPALPIIALTPHEEIQRALLLSFGVIPLVSEFHTDPERTVELALTTAKKAGLIKKGQKVVLVTDAKAHHTSHSSVQVRTV